MMNRRQVSAISDQNSKCWIQYFSPKIAAFLSAKMFSNIFDKGMALQYTLPSFKNLFVSYNKLCEMKIMGGKKGTRQSFADVPIFLPLQLATKTCMHLLSFKLKNLN